MPEEIKQDQATEQDQVTETAEPTLDEKLAEIEAKLEAKYKSQIAGLDKKVSEQSKKLQDAELAKLDEKARAEEEIRIAQEERDRIKTETENIRRERMIEKVLLENELPVEFAKRISGDTEDNVKEDAKILKDFIDKQVEAGVEKWRNETLGGEGPKASSTPQAGDLQGLYNEAKKNNHKAEIVAIQRQAAKDGIELKL